MKKHVSIVWTKTKSELEELVKVSETFTDLILRLGYKSRERGREAVKKCLDSYGIDYQELIRNGRKKSFANLATRSQDGKITRKYTNEELFVKGSHDGNHIKKRILDEGLIPYKCSICGQEPIWNGKPMTLVLDHINGDHSDNRLENLRFVCRNCDSQLPTFCGRNFKSGTSSTCPVCGKRKDYKAKLCRSCSNIAKKAIPVSREDLYNICVINSFRIEDILSNLNISKEVLNVWRYKYNIEVPDN